MSVADSGPGIVDHPDASIATDDAGEQQPDSGTIVIIEDAGVRAPVYTLDLRSLEGSAPADLPTRRAQYDLLTAVACVQGIVNRTAPNLYLFYKSAGGTDIDQLWLTRLADPAIGADILTGRTITPLASLDAVLDTFPTAIKGLAVWDERVPASVNAAFTAAGADDLIAVRFDADPASLYSKLKARGLPVTVSLVNPDGTSRFKDDQGAGLVPDTARQTSQSAKADVYVWAIEKYLKPGKLNPTELGTMLDAFWLAHPGDYNGNLQPTGQLQLPNRDWLVAKRGLPFDLSPWDDVAATDDPGQPIGTDPAITREIVSAARAKAADQIISVRGFFAWHFKYTTLEGLPAGHEPVMGEWTSVKLISPFAAGLDADAPGHATMANASFFMHVPLSTTPPPQHRPTPEDLIGNGFLKGLAGNGGFEDGLDGWVPHTTNRLVFTDDVASGPRAHGGLRYLRVNTAAVGADDQDNLYRDGRATAPGEKVTLRAFVRAAAGTVTGELVIWGIGGTAESASTPFTATAQWQEVRTTLTIAQAGHLATRAQIYLRTANANLELDDVAFYAGDAASSAIEPANYFLWYVGDFDAASWSYAFSPSVWDAPGRGIVPLAWGFSGHVAPRVPMFFRHLLATRTERDFFVGADNGPGYGNPSQMAAPAREIWANAGVQASRILDTSMGWVLDPLAPIDAAHLTATTPYFGDGVLLMTARGGVANGSLVDHAPVVSLGNLDGTTDAEKINGVLAAVGGAPAAPRFTSLRTVLPNVNGLVNVTNALVTQHGDRKIRVVDPMSFFALARRQFGGDNEHRASYVKLTLAQPLQVGHPITGTLTVRNDSWHTWPEAGANPVHLGFSVTKKAPRARTLNQLGDYQTRVSLPNDVLPGAEATVSFTLPAPTVAGAQTLQIDLVEEGVTWFETAGDIPLQTALAVVP